MEDDVAEHRTYEARCTNHSVNSVYNTRQGKEDNLNSSYGRVVWSVCLLSCRLGFDSESGQTNDFNIGIHSFPAWRSALKGQCGKFTCCAVGKGT